MRRACAVCAGVFPLRSELRRMRGRLRPTTVAGDGPAHAAARGGGVAVRVVVLQLNSSYGYDLTRPARACDSRTGPWVPWALGAQRCVWCCAGATRWVGRACGSGPGTLAPRCPRCGAVRCVSCLSAPRRGPWSPGAAASERRARVPVRVAWRRARPDGRSVPGCGAAVRPRRSARP